MLTIAERELDEFDVWLAQAGAGLVAALAEHLDTETVVRALKARDGRR